MIQYLQYGRERFKALPYSIVFWVHPSFSKQLFQDAPDFHHWLFGTYDFSDVKLAEIQVFHQGNQKIFQETFVWLNFYLLNNIHRVNRFLTGQNKIDRVLDSIDKYLEKLIWQYEHWQEVKDSTRGFLKYLHRLKHKYWQKVKGNGGEFLFEVMGRVDLRKYYIQQSCTDKDEKIWLLNDFLDNLLANNLGCG